MPSIDRTDTRGGFGYSASLSHGRAMLDERRKRLRFRAWRRGFREIDLILGGFADRHIATLDASEVDAFEALLKMRDLDVYDWITGAVAPPPEHDTALLGRLRRFTPGAADPGP